MTWKLDHYVDPTILSLSGRDLIIDHSDSEPIDSVEWSSLRHLGDHLLRDVGLERPENRYKL